MIGDDAAPLPGDLLLQAVEGMERPLFVLDDDWRFSYMNPSGARAARRDGRRTGRPGDLGGLPGDHRQPVRAELPPGGERRASRPASRPGTSRCRSGSRWTRSAPTAGWSSPTTTSPSDAAPRTSVRGERAVAAAARGRAEEPAGT